jgi:hypothetical protein
MLVLCNGMARSGSTLQYNLVCDVVEAAGVGTGHGGAENDLGPGPDLREANATPEVKVYKAHEALRGTVPWIAQGHDGVRICYIHRDLRDVAVSLREMQGGEEDHIVGVLDDAVLAYNELRPVRDSPYVLWQCYEDVVADVRGATGEIARFLKLEVPSNIIDEIADGCAIDSARQVMTQVRRLMEADLARADASEVRRVRKAMRDRTQDWRDPVTLIHWNHISRHGGASGVWRTELPEPLLATIVERYAEWFADAGYATDDAQVVGEEGVGE